MRRALHARVWLVPALLVTALGAGPIPRDVDPDQFEKAARTILCDCGCHPQSVYDCACGRAAEMRDQIAAEIRRGKTGAEVIAQYVARYGDQIRIAPTATGFNLVAWLGPLFLLVAGGAAIVWVLRRWSRRWPAAEPEPPSKPAARDTAYLDRLQADLKEYSE